MKYTLANPYKLPISDGSSTYDPRDLVKGRVYNITKLPCYFFGGVNIDVNGFAERTLQATKSNTFGYKFTLTNVTEHQVRVEVSHKLWQQPLIFTMPCYRHKREISKNTIAVVWDLDLIEQLPFDGWGGANGFMRYLMNLHSNELTEADRLMPTAAATGT